MIFTYNPPEYNKQSTGLRDQVKEFIEDYWSKFFFYNKKFLSEREAGDTTPFSTIVAATTLAPTRKIQAVSGSATVQTISAQPNFSPFVILAVDGFSTGTSGNISAAVTLAAGTTKHFYYHPGLTKWFPSA